MEQQPGHSGLSTWKYLLKSSNIELGNYTDGILNCRGTATIQLSWIYLTSYYSLLAVSFVLIQSKQLSSVVWRRTETMIWTTLRWKMSSWVGNPSWVGRNMQKGTATKLLCKIYLYDAPAALRVIHTAVKCTENLARFRSRMKWKLSEVEWVPDKSQNLARIWVLLRTYKWGFKRRLHIQLVKRFGFLFGSNIVPQWSKKFGKIFDPNI